MSHLAKKFFEYINREKIQQSQDILSKLSVVQGPVNTISEKEYEHLSASKGKAGWEIALHTHKGIDSIETKILGHQPSLPDAVKALDEIALQRFGAKRNLFNQQAIGAYQSTSQIIDLPNVRAALAREERNPSLNWV